MTTVVHTILYAEDDTHLAKLYIQAFEKAGFYVVYTPIGETVFSLYKKHSPDVVLLDLMLPKKNGFEAAGEIRKENKEVPILIITSMSDSSTAVKGFGIGINDYIRKEYSTEETIARIQSHLTENYSVSNYVEITPTCWIDTQNQSLVVNKECFNLSISEYKLLCLLYKNRHIVIDRNAIIEEIWSKNKINSPLYLNKTISYLRRYLQHTNITITSYFKRGIKLEIR